MSHRSSPSPEGKNAMMQDEEIEQIASHIDWNDHGDAQNESGYDESPQIELLCLFKNLNHDYQSKGIFVILKKCKVLFTK